MPTQYVKLALAKSRVTRNRNYVIYVDLLYFNSFIVIVVPFMTDSSNKVLKIVCLEQLLCELLYYL